jgi:hypothetical protein
MAIGDDFSYDTLNKTITHDSGSTIYSMNAYYSWLMDEFDDLIQMDDVVPISAQTPTAYTHINGWFLDYGDGSNAHEYLDGGALETVGWNGTIKMVPYTATTSFGASDKGKVLTGSSSGDSGTILSYDNRDAVDDGVVWLRTTDAFDDASELYTVAASSAAGTITPSSTGENLWTNLYTLGTLEGSPQLYITRDDTRLTEWWSTGQIDVIILIKEAGTELGDNFAGSDTGWVQVWDRTWTDLWDWFEVNLGPGGRQAVPLATFDDLNNQTAEGTVATWTDVVISVAGPYSEDIGDGAGPQNYDYSINCGGRILSQVYERLKYVTRDGETTQIDGVDGEQYITVVGQEATYTPVKQAPFGTFAGGIFFGARGIWIYNMAGADQENYQLIDSAGTTRNPPTQAPITVGSVAAYDAVLVCESTGEGLTVIDKAQYTISGTILSGANYIDVTVPIPQDTPTSGFIRVLDVGVSEERYTYSGWADHTFGLIENTSKQYDGPTDTAYVPYIDTFVPSGSTSITQSLIYDQNRWLVGRVRQYGIIPFESTAQLVTGGVTITAIRTEDTIVA